MKESSAAMPRLQDNEPNDGADVRPMPDEIRANLFKSRTVLLFGEITSELARAKTAELLALAAASDDPIRVVLHSPGGHVESGDTLHDVIKFIGPRVNIVGTGWVASAGALVYVAASKDRRFALPNTRFLLHQPLGGVRGPSSDIQIEAVQILSIRARLNRIFADATGREVERVTRETERNLWMTAEEAKDYGLVGKIVGRANEV